MHAIVLLDWQGEGGHDLSSLGRKRGEAKVKVVMREAKVKVVMPHPFHCLARGRNAAMLTRRRMWTWPLL